jgi:transcriptional regulator with XRE-family HTH domain
MLHTGKTLPEWAVKLKKYRKTNGYTQEEFGAYFDVTGMAVSYWEAGRTEPPAKVFVWILLAAGVVSRDSIVDDTLPSFKLGKE